MNETEVDTSILAILHRVAPDTINIDVDPDRSLRDQIDFDSLDLMRLALEIEKSFCMKISAIDYMQLASLSGASRYVMKKCPDGS